MVARSEGRPIFLDLADQIADDILAGVYPEETAVPSTNELAAHYRINPATAGKALNRLVDAEILYKKRGVGMFVATGAPHALRLERRTSFTAEYLRPLLAEGRRLGLTTSDIVAMITEEDPS